MNQKNPKSPFVRLMLVFVIVVIIGVGVNKLLTESGSGFFNTAEIAETKEKRQIPEDPTKTGQRAGHPDIFRFK